MQIIQGVKYRWHMPNATFEQTNDLSAAHNLPIPLIQVLLNRGINSHDKITSFLFTPEQTNVTSSQLLADAPKAVDRILRAIDQKEKILIVGDYDVDGISATALMLICLLPLNERVNYFLPHRVHDGYGLSPKTIALAAQNKYSLVITVDNGISAFQAAQTAQEKSIDLIITDHHQPMEHLPVAHTIVNPARADCSYPFKELAGVGVAFKLMQLLYERLGRQLPEKVYELLMLGTIADMVSLIGENRYWVRYGLVQARKNASYSLQLLCKNVRLADEKKLSATDVAFFIAPQLNALGRLQDPRQGVHFLVSNNQEQVISIAHLLAELNEARKDVEQIMSAEIHEAIAAGRINLDNERVIMAASSQWPQGIIGLVASRLVAEYGRPALLFHLGENGIAKGSGRSIISFNLFKALQETRDLLNHFGGHACAAGISLPADKLPELKSRLEQLIAQTVSLHELIPTIDVDAHAQLHDLNGHFIDSLAYLAPFGTMNKEPVFYFANVCLVAEPQLLKGTHVKCRVFSQGVLKPVIFFNRPELFSWLVQQQDRPFNLAASVQENFWQGTRSVQLRGIDVAQGDQ